MQDLPSILFALISGVIGTTSSETAEKFGERAVMYP